MSRKSTKSQAAVERLLDERRQFEAWLAKLAEQAAAGVPSHVADRVRADYQSRLDNVIRQLARFEGDLETSLAETEMRRDDLVKQRGARAETLAEAELRHQVGEYDEGKFAELSAEQTAALAQLGEEIEAAERDIARYEEILAQIAGVLPELSAGPPAPAPAAPAPAAPVPSMPSPAPAPAAVASPPAPAPAEAAAPPAAMRPAAEAAAAPADAVAGAESGAAPKAEVKGKALDELDFIRSVAATEAAQAPVTPAPAPPKPAERPPAAAPAAAKREGPAPARNGARAAAPAPKGQPFPELVGRAEPEVPGEPAKERSLRKTTGDADPATKTLRCTECGTNNLPTEWYCEKCGAELSAF